VGYSAGSAYAFRFYPGMSAWVEEAKLTPSDTAAGDWFGHFISVSGDIALVGAPYDDDAGYESGSAYVFSLGLLRAVSEIVTLVDVVIDLNIQQGIANGLDAKLSSALQALQDVNQNNDVAAINSLQAFINAVEAQSGNHIPVEDANALISAAQQIIDLLL
jgi:hypothetical protein